MAKLDGPLQLAPTFSPRPWGRKHLAPLYDVDPKHTASVPPKFRNQVLGEAWLTADDSIFRNGPVAGMALADAVKAFGGELVGQNVPPDRFPILLKFIFTNEWLSIQVHPDNEQARLQGPGAIGKTEMWYVAAASRDAEYLLGLRQGVTAESLRRASHQGKLQHKLRRFRAKRGEAIFVPAGTLHTLGPGLTVFEVEQNSDITYRLDDYGRPGPDGKPRPLHIEEGLEAARLDAVPHRNLPKIELREPFGKRRFVLACRYFAVELLTLERMACLSSSPGRVELLAILSGSGRVENASGWWGFRSGEAWAIPPGAGGYRLMPRDSAQVFRCYVPNLDADFRRPLLRRRVRAATVSRIIFE